VAQLVLFQGFVAVAPNALLGKVSALFTTSFRCSEKVPKCVRQGCVKAVVVRQVNKEIRSKTKVEGNLAPKDVRRVAPGP
jgi:hypothetical protein